MGSMKIAGFVGIALLISIVWAVPKPAVSQDEPSMEEKAAATRQGYMKIVVWEAGPLFGMAKGDVEYDADLATVHANRLKEISEYPVGSLFIPGSSNADIPGKTRSLPKIWEDMAGFDKALTDFQNAVTTVNDQAGVGQPELAAAVGELGKTCGGCHKPFRADE